MPKLKTLAVRLIAACSIAVFSTSMAALPTPASAQVPQAQVPVLPRGLEASPDIYKVATENDRFAVVEVTWQPGQHDRPHSLGANAIYYLTDCNLRWIHPDKTTFDLNPKAGDAFIQSPVPAQVIENIGKSACRLVMFEQR